ncbi:EAL domain-containing protein [Acidovorax sp. HDW3]|uniref:sensor domain-containing protein n=1 Tax=Acidovorax sp. HDW3 TaxID=2714923 RepID=UPI001407E57E|nr:EAL domain-containing protein [Acidovorax sp. HDW3]QIL43962.1 EAL domain-containing protein [Acidovorax sp. HDW3]
MPDSVAPLLLPPDVLHAMQAMGCGYWQWDVVRRQLQFAGAFYRPFGVFEQPPEQVHRYWDSLRHPDDAGRLKDYLQRVRAGFEENYASEGRIRDLQGQWHWIASRGRVAERDAKGQPLRIVGLTKDVTRRRKQQEELQAFNSLLLQAGRLARLGTWELTPNQGIIYWSDMCYAIHGLPLGAPLPRHYTSTHVALPWRQALRDKLTDCLRFGLDWSMELQIVRSDGELIWVRAHGEPVVENGRLQRVRGVMQDINDYKLAEVQLRQSEEHFTRIFQLVEQPMGMVHCGDGHYQYVNPAWEALTGYSAAEAMGHGSVELGFFTPEDRAQMLAALGQGDTLSNYEIKLRRRDGQVRTLLQSLRRLDYYDEPCWLFSAQDITEHKQRQEQLQHLAHFDPLTGLPNRVQLAQRLQDAMAQARQAGQLLGVAYLDLDGFKPINDRLGHEAGDRLLIAAGARMARSLRSSDCVARLGGDEFVILLPGLGTRSDCEHKLQQLMQRLATPYTLDTERVTITASIGYTLYPEDDADADTLLRHADQAMYQAKQAGRNRFHGFDALQARSQREQQAQGEQLRQALARGEFVLHLQPQIDMASGAVVGAECLARWQHPERGLLSPAHFLPAIEGTTLEIEFGQWACAEALRHCAQLQRQGLTLRLAVNIAAQHVQQPGFTRALRALLDGHPQLDASWLEIEITESAALYDLDALTTELTELRQLGVRIALDDFGTGYSSLSYLRHLPLDLLKIDQSFVRDMLTDPGDLAIVQSVIGLAQSFGRQVIAEGVETAAQGARLQQLGCTLAQGYHFARPMPLDALVAWLQHTSQGKSAD